MTTIAFVSSGCHTFSPSSSASESTFVCKLVTQPSFSQCSRQRCQDENSPRVRQEKTTLLSFATHAGESWKRYDPVLSSLCSAHACSKAVLCFWLLHGTWVLDIKKQDKLACDTAVPSRRCGWSEKVCHNVTASPAQPSCRGVMGQSCEPMINTCCCLLTLLLRL